MYIDGVWKIEEVNPKTDSGSFDRKPVSFRSQISVNSKFAPESNRYHLYVSYACPWASRVLIFRELKGLTEHISVDVVHPFMGDEGWTFAKDWQGATGDSLQNHKKLGEVYLAADPKFTGRVTVPVLWDKVSNTIVNNESSDIIRIFNSAFNHLTGNPSDYYPEGLRPEIDEINAEIYEKVNNGVYKSGFARSQEAYEKAVVPLFSTLEDLEKRLEGRQYLIEDRLTEADIRLFVTLIRFDLVYVCHFKCNLKRIEDFPNLRAYMRRLYAMDAFRNTTFFDHIKSHYYESHKTLNPFGLVPLGPELDYVN